MFFGPLIRISLMRRVLEQQLQRPEAERLVQHLVDQPLALVAVEQRVFGVAQMFDDQADFAAQHVALQLADSRQVELVDQLAVNAALEILELGFLRFIRWSSDGRCSLGHRVSIAARSYSPNARCAMTPS